MDKNKILADFIGMKYGEERQFKNGEWIHSVRSLSKFEHDWNYLMWVVNDIYNATEKHSLISSESMLILRDALSDASIKGVYDALVDIANEYNQLQSI